MSEIEVNRRAERLLLLYPRSWRQRYGEEFSELLVAEITERPRSLYRTLDLVRGGMVAHLADLGLCGYSLDGPGLLRANLVSNGTCSALFVALAAALWAQLTIGWQWAPPDTVGTRLAMYVMSGVMAAFLLIAILAGAPILWAAITSVLRRRRERALLPLLMVIAFATALSIGSRHFGNGWPGTGGHHWAEQGLVPGGVAAFSWASTLSFSSYWAHPGALGGFPPAELAWMAVSPLGIVGIVVGISKLLRRVSLCPAVMRFEAGLAKVAAGLMLVFLLGCGLWMVDGGAGPHNLFHAGAIDVAAVVLMLASWVGIEHTTIRTRRALNELAANNVR